MRVAGTDGPSDCHLLGGQTIQVALPLIRPSEIAPNVFESTV